MNVQRARPKLEALDVEPWRSLVDRHHGRVESGDAELFADSLGILGVTEGSEDRGPAVGNVETRAHVIGRHAQNRRCRLCQPRRVSPQSIDYDGIHRRSLAAGSGAVNRPVALRVYARSVATAGTESERETLQIRHQRLRLEARLFGTKETLKVGRYRLGERLGSGGMGSVYEAHDASLDRRVAIKVLQRRTLESPGANARLVREAKALARLSHPHVLTVHEVGVEEEQPFIAMEHVPGGTLAEIDLGEGPARVQRLTSLLRQCAEGLLAAHDAGLVHRDFKPQNVLIDERGAAKVADFGVVLWSDSGPAPSPADDPMADLDDGSSITQDGRYPGTPHYMAPEQGRGQADARTDQFALCKTFLELFDGTAPPRLAQVLERGASRDPDDRHADLRVFLAEVDRAVAPRGRIAILAAAGVVLLGSGAALAMAGTDREAAGGPEDNPCTEGREKLEDAWGDERQTAIREAFERSERESWRGTWDSVRGRLDAYVDTWADAHLDACEATRVRGGQDETTMRLRLACLDQRAVVLKRLSDEYVGASPEVVDEALSTSLALPPVAACSDRDELEIGPQGLALDDPEVRKLYDDLGEADLLRELNRTEEADAAYRDLVPRLEARGLPGLTARCYLGRAGISTSLTRFEEAETLARKALSHAEAEGDTSTMTRAWIRLTDVALLQNDTEAAELYIERAESLASRDEDAPALQAAVQNARGKYFGRTSRPAEAIAAYERASALAVEAGGRELFEIGVRWELAHELSLLGRDEEGRALAAELLQEAVETFGPRSRVTLGLQCMAADQAFRAGEHERAATLSEASLELSITGLRADNLLDCRATYAMAQQRLERFDLARAVLEGIVEEGAAHFGADHISVFMARMQLGPMLLEEGKHAEALAHLAPMADFIGTDPDQSPHPGIHPMNRCAYWSNMGQAQAVVGELEEAVRSVEVSLAICRKVAASKSIWMFISLRYAAEVFETAGELAKTKAALSEAVAIADEIDVPPEEGEWVEQARDRLGV